MDLQSDLPGQNSQWRPLEVLSLALPETLSAPPRQTSGLGKIPGRVGIEHRSKAIDERLHIGHWEGDTILHGHKNSGAVTLVERRSGYLFAGCAEAESRLSDRRHHP